MECVQEALGGHVAVDRDAPLMDLGIDSIAAVALRGTISERLNLPLPATMMFDFPTVALLVVFIETSLFPKEEADVKSQTASLHSTPNFSSEDHPGYGIMAMSCRLPGGGEDTHLFWKFLMSGGDAICDVPGRWQPSEYADQNVDAPGKAYVQRAGFVQGIECFDAKVFGISTSEATVL